MSLDDVLDHGTALAEGVDDGQWIGSEQCRMSETAATRNRTMSPRPEVAYFWDRARRRPQIALFVSVQKPIPRVRTGIKAINEPEIAIDPHQEHCAVDAMSPHIGGMMIGSAKPRPGAGDRPRRAAPQTIEGSSAYADARKTRAQCPCDLARSNLFPRRGLFAIPR